MHGIGTRVAAVVVPPSRLVVFAGGASFARTATGEPTFVVLNVLGVGGATRSVVPCVWTALLVGSVVPRKPTPPTGGACPAPLPDKPPRPCVFNPRPRAPPRPCP